MDTQKPEHCGCEACEDGTTHLSDCAVHNEPAYPNGPCDCGVTTPGSMQAEAGPGDTRNMTGFAATLNPEQLGRALNYRGPENIGHDRNCPAFAGTGPCKCMGQQ